MFTHTIFSYNKRGNWLYIALQKSFGEEGISTTRILKARQAYDDETLDNQLTIGSTIAQRKYVFLFNPFKWLEFGLFLLYEGWNQLTLLGKSARPAGDTNPLNNANYKVGVLSFWHPIDWLRILARIPLYAIQLAIVVTQWYSSAWNQIWRPFRNYCQNLWQYGAGGNNAAYGDPRLGYAALFLFVTTVITVTTLTALAIFAPPTVIAMLPFAKSILPALAKLMTGAIGAKVAGAAIVVGFCGATSSILRNIKPFFIDLWYGGILSFVGKSTKGYDPQMELVALATYDAENEPLQTNNGYTNGLHYASKTGRSLYENSNAESFLMFNDRLQKWEGGRPTHINFRNSQFFTAPGAEKPADEADPILGADAAKVSTKELGFANITVQAYHAACIQGG